VRIWNPATGVSVRELRIHGRAPQWYLVAATGRLIAAVDAKGAVAAVWDAETGSVTAEFVLDRAEKPALAFSGDGRWLAAGGGERMQIVDTASWRRVASIPGTRIAWDPTGPRILIGNADGGASIWSADLSVRHLRRSGEDPIDTVDYSPDGTRVALARRSGAVQVITTDGRLISTSNYLGDKVLSIEFSPDGGSIVAAGVTGAAAVSETSTGMLVTLLQGAAGVVRTVRWDTHARRIVGASWDGTARVWDASSPYRRWSSQRPVDGCGLVGGAEPDGRYLAVACPGHPTRVYDTARDRLLAELPSIADGDPAPFPAVSTAGDLAAIARDTAAELYELPSGRLLRRIEHGAAVTAVAFGPSGELASGSADGSTLLTAPGRDPVKLARGGAEVRAVVVLRGGTVVAADIRGHVMILGGDSVDLNAGVRARMLRLSPDGRYALVVPSYRDSAAPAVLLDLAQRRAVTRLDAPHTYTARWVDGGWLTAHADGSARRWLADGTPLQVYRGGHRNLVDAAVNGPFVIGGGGDGTIRVWDAASGQQLWTMIACSSSVMGVRAADGDIVARDADGTVSRWHLPKL
jgi:WD40 repeat protein